MSVPHRHCSDPSMGKTRTEAFTVSEEVPVLRAVHSAVDTPKSGTCCQQGSLRSLPGGGSIWADLEGR